jgi:hypothetical protein
VLVVLLLLSAPAAGCGGASKASSANASSASPSSHTQTTTERTAHETRQDIVAAVAACRQGVDTGSWLPKASKTQLYASCDQGLRRGLTEIRAFGLEVCNEVAFTSPAKTAAERTRVFAACYAGTKQKTAMIGN